MPCDCKSARFEVVALKDFLSEWFETIAKKVTAIESQNIQIKTEVGKLQHILLSEDYNNRQSRDSTEKTSKENEAPPTLDCFLGFDSQLSDHDVDMISVENPGDVFSMNSVKIEHNVSSTARRQSYREGIDAAPASVSLDFCPQSEWQQEKVEKIVDSNQLNQVESSLVAFDPGMIGSCSSYFPLDNIPCSGSSEGKEKQHNAGSRKKGRADCVIKKKSGKSPKSMLEVKKKILMIPGIVASGRMLTRAKGNSTVAAETVVKAMQEMDKTYGEEGFVGVFVSGEVLGRGQVAFFKASPYKIDYKYLQDTLGISWDVYRRIFYNQKVLTTPPSRGLPKKWEVYYAHLLNNRPEHSKMYPEETRGVNEVVKNEIVS